MRLILPFAPFLKDKEGWSKSLDNWRFLYAPSNQKFHVVGDNPILRWGDSTKDPVRVLEEFIFPISSSILLVNLREPLKGGLSGEFTIQHGTAMIERARRFVVSPNEQYLDALVGRHREYTNHQANHLIDAELFKLMER